MSEQYELTISELRRKHRQGRRPDGNGEFHSSQESGPRQRRRQTWTRVVNTGQPLGQAEPTRSKWAAIDIFHWLDALTERWKWVGAGTALLGGIAFLIGVALSDYSLHVTLMRREAVHALIGGDQLQPRELSLQTLLGMMVSPEVLKRVSRQADPPVSPQRLSRTVRAFPTRNPDFIILSISGQKNKQDLVNLANLYVAEAIEYTRDLQASVSGELSEFLLQRLEDADRKLESINAQLIAYAREAEVFDFGRELDQYLAQAASINSRYESARIDLETTDMQVELLKQQAARHDPGSDRLQAARATLLDLRTRFQDHHPAVARQQDIVRQMESQAAQGGAATREPESGATFAGPLGIRIQELQAMRPVLQRQMKELESAKLRIEERAKTLSEKAVPYAVLKSRQQQLETTRNIYAERQRDAKLLKDNALGYFRPPGPATLQEVSARKRVIITAGLTIAGAGAGLVLAALLVLLIEVSDSRVRTALDLERASRLPLLATLGDLRRISPAEQVNWAFRTLTLLQGKLARAPNQSLVCGLISSRPGEGRSTWINLLVSAASQRGLRVLTVATRPNPVEEEEPSEFVEKNPSLLPVGPSTTLNTQVLARPEKVTEQFADPEAQPVVHIPIPGWVWNLERRRQWQSAIEHWQQMNNLVLLIELPPASQPESVLLAENLPQVLWLASSGMATVDETRQHLETLRHANVNITGAVLNREPSSRWRARLGWLNRFSVLLAAAAALNLGAEEPRPESEAPPTALPAFSVVDPSQRAAWQERLTLGPGDVIDIEFYGSPALSRTNVVISPDGSLNYLQVQEFPATGLTVDELRVQLDEALLVVGYRTPRAMIYPVQFNSKRYVILGRVMGRGVYVMDRPLTIIEAVARAQGLETGLLGRETVELADLSRSFIVRNGERMPIDFERLFHQGDLSQNVPLEPDDFLYFAAAAINEVYVLGEVIIPGRTVSPPDLSIVAAITGRGGFTQQAYQRKVLVVRGSLQRPETFIVDVHAILHGRRPDFKLEARDIVYVAARPWARVEELLDIAAQSFIQGAVTGWVTGNIGPVFRSPVLPRL